jgi:flagellar motility protein MotE (MotC chaperone)
MDPKRSAKIFDEIEVDLAAEILKQMRQDKAAEILSRMSSERARKVTERFLGGTAEKTGSGLSDRNPSSEVNEVPMTTKGGE